MSITLITAAPGAGKTLYAVWNIIKPAIEQERVVYTSGIPELKLPTISMSYSQMKHWPEREIIEQENPTGIPIPDDEKPTRLLNITEGSLIVIDECQYLWPASGSKEPGEDIKYLTKHRHHGLEFILITQAPQLIHKNVLAVIDKHIHMVTDWHGRKRYEWPEYCTTVRAASSKLRAVTQRYDLPKQAYGLYRSASMHVTQKRRKPIMAYMVPLAIMFLAYTGYNVKNRLIDQQPSDQVAVNQPAIEPPSQPPDQQAVQPPAEPKIKILRPVTHAVVSQNIDWTNVSSCIASEKKCICYGKSSEQLVIPPETCRKAVKSGWPQAKPQLTDL